MTDKAFEVVAECAMAGFPTNADITRVTEQIERARRRDAAIARAAVQTPAVYKDRAYTLVARFLVWARDGSGAMDTVGSLLQGAGVHCRGMHLSGRALVEADLLRPARVTAPAAARSKAGAAKTARIKTAARAKKRVAKAAGRPASRGKRAARPVAKKARRRRAARPRARRRR